MLPDLTLYRASTADRPMSEVFPPPGQEVMKDLLTPEQFNVCYLAATERRGTGEYDRNYQAGTYLCRICGLPLFVSDVKFDSGTGWPSFFQAADPQHVRGVRDSSGQTEIVCANCRSHLGHVFPDGPAPTGLRFCMNSASLRFVAVEAD